MVTGKIRKFMVDDVLRNPILRKYSLWAFLIGSITLILKFGSKAFWIIIPLSFALCVWIFWASGSFQEMKEGGQRIRWMIDARKKEKLKEKEADRR